MCNLLTEYTNDLTPFLQPEFSKFQDALDLIFANIKLYNSFS